MEFFLHLWDELDDWSAACRHVTAVTVAEMAELSTAASTLVSTLTLWLIRLGG